MPTLSPQPPAATLLADHALVVPLSRTPLSASGNPDFFWDSYFWRVEFLCYAERLHPLAVTFAVEKNTAMVKSRDVHPGKVDPRLA